jgi:hypothetical protein
MRETSGRGKNGESSDTVEAEKEWKERAYTDFSRNFGWKHGGKEQIRWREEEKEKRRR